MSFSENIHNRKNYKENHKYYLFSDDLVLKNPPAKAGNAGLIPGLGRSPGGGNGNILQYSCLGNPTDREAWWATVHGVKKRVRHDLVTKQQD